MKKNTLKSLVAYLNGQEVTNLDEIKSELEAELAKNEEKAQANRDLYATAREIVMKYMSEVPQTVADIFAACESELPDGFSKGKIQYALLNTWAADVVKVENPHGANQYRLK